MGAPPPSCCIGVTLLLLLCGRASAFLPAAPICAGTATSTTCGTRHDSTGSRANRCTTRLRNSYDDDKAEDGWVVSPGEVARRRKAKMEKLTEKKKSVNRGSLAMDDFLGKRMGKGQAFYGQNLSNMSDEEILTMQDMKMTGKAEEKLAQQDLKPNAVFVTGVTGQVGQWVVLDLLQKGFNVRASSSSGIEKVESLFGPDGANVDIVLGDIDNDAMKGCQAVVFCPESKPVLGSERFAKADLEGLRSCVEASKAEGVQRMVLCSSIGVTTPDNVDFVTKLTGNPLPLLSQAEAVVRAAKDDLPYVIVRPGKVTDAPGGLGSLELGQGDSFDFSRANIPYRDVAEALVEALVGEPENFTFEVMSALDGEAAATARRPAYLELDVERMMEREKEEEGEVEAFWANQFAEMTVDSGGGGEA